MDVLNMVMNAANGGDRVITGAVADAVAAFREAGKCKIPLFGNITMYFTDTADGLNVRNVYGDVKKMHSVMKDFCHTYAANFTVPLYDGERNALVATNGYGMILCDIPSGTSAADAVACGFRDNNGLFAPWWNAISDRIVSAYSLSCMKKIMEVEKGGELHNQIVGAAECARAAEYKDKDGFTHRIWGTFGKKHYNLVYVADLVNAVFKMGNKKVGLYEQTGWAGWTECEHTPLHIVGLDGGNNSRALLMPFRCGLENYGTFVFPAEGEAAAA